MSQESIEIFIMVARSLGEYVHRLIDQRNGLQDLSQFILNCGHCRRGHCCCIGNSILLGLFGELIATGALKKYTVSVVAKALTLSSSATFCCLLGCSTTMCYQRCEFTPYQLIISIKHKPPPYGELPENGIGEDVQNSLRRLISSFYRIGSWPALYGLSDIADNMNIRIG